MTFFCILPFLFFSKVIIHGKLLRFSNNDGGVISRNGEATEVGMHLGLPLPLILIGIYW
jgi:hypothetical protein